MEHSIYWLWLTLKSEINENELNALIREFYSAQTVYDIDDRRNLHGYREETVNAVMDKSLDNAKEVYAKIVHIGGYILTFEDVDYPHLLRNIYSPPYVLYAKGQRLDWTKLLTITVVGTRRYNDYGRRATEHIAGGLAKAGVTIVSGMARGIDSFAGGSALRNGAKTVAVLGSGIDVVYPPENAGFYDTICRNGAVITEFPPGTRPLRENFPKRNRIMAGLSYGILITQAPKKSGALITAGLALEDGKDVFVVPNGIFDACSQGSNELIKQGAKAVSCAEDILDEYPYINLDVLKSGGEDTVSVTRTEIREDKTEKIDWDSLNELQTKIVKLLNGEGRHIDVMARELETASSEINSELVMLEINGIVRKLNGNIYELM